MLPADSSQHARSLPKPGKGHMLWHPKPSRRENLLVAFRATFELAEEADVDFQILGAHYFEVGLDNEHLTEGPWRFTPASAEYECLRRRLPAGRHVLSASVLNIGVHVEYIKADVIPPFFMARIFAGGGPLALDWKCRELDGYRHLNRRISSNMAWIEVTDSRRIPRDWEEPGYDDSMWSDPVPVATGPVDLSVLEAPPLARVPIELKPNASGALYAHDIDLSCEEPAWAFYARRYDDPDSNGCWFRFDLGRVALGKLQLRVRAPEGTGVAMASSDFLLNGRVSPWIVTSHGQTANLNLMTLRGADDGEYAYPILPRGGRYWEVHFQAPVDELELLECTYLERTSAPKATGSFACGDSQMEKIWRVGVNTLRACSEDAILDCPTRERGQWGGDGLTVGMEVAHAAGHDMRLLARGLRQAAACAREDGLVAGLYPGAIQYLPTYSLYWASACWRYFQITRDEAPLRDLIESANRNFAAFEAVRRDDNLCGDLPEAWPFVDWGYAPPPGEPNIPLSAALADAYRDAALWARHLGEDALAEEYVERRDATRSALLAWKRRSLVGGWDSIGYHAGVFLLRSGLVENEETPALVDFLQRHIMSCYPNDRSAPRLGSPSTFGDRFLTPFFCHFALPPMVEAGDFDFVLSLFRRCWGWALGHSDGTWLEVFDPNWSHCHQWSSAPTWMLTRYAAGLNARYDLGKRHFELSLADSLIPEARGFLPFAYEEGGVGVHWRREGDLFDVEIETSLPIVIHLPCPEGGDSPEPVEVARSERLRCLSPRFNRSCAGRGVLEAK